MYGCHYSNLRPIIKRKHFGGFFYVCNVTFEYVSHLDAKPDGSVAVMSCFDARFMNFYYKAYQFRGVEACLGFQIQQKR